MFFFLFFVFFITKVHITSEQQAENEKSVFISKQGKINFVGMQSNKSVNEIIFIIFFTRHKINC